MRGFSFGNTWSHGCILHPINIIVTKKLFTIGC
jgi:hypothetical protein